jgi:hypothetical protein
VDDESQPLLGYHWTRITNVIGTVEGHYMTYSNTFTTSPPARYNNIYLHAPNLVVLTSVKDLQVTWQPYETNEVQGMALNVICRHEQDLWMIVLLLICYYIVEWHLPICVVHQFGGL